jgi:23S rRNA (cytidine1920-2'-O)/16S rRNA (cytidine1409-2'-O)-methyltransferase
VATRKRADVLMIEQGLASTADEAARFIMAGRVRSGSARVEKAGELLPGTTRLELSGAERYVSRGGYKLEHALVRLAVDVKAKVCLDAGCSSGGFTDCLLQHGARLVHAVDVGYGQLAWTLRQDERVRVYERTNVRTLAAGSLVPAPEVVVADLAFIALRTVLPTLASLVVGDWRMVLMVKPQFELPRTDVAGGVVEAPELHQRAVELVVAKASELGMTCLGTEPSPLRGPEGNREFFVCLAAR